MSRVRGKDNRAEVLLRHSLWARGWRYRLYVRTLPGSPDIVFPRARTVVFVDGDYWHGRALLERGPEALAEIFRGRQRDYWVAKITRNVARDRKNTAELKRLGWRVIRVWERDVLRAPQRAIHRVERVLHRALALTEPDSRDRRGG